MRNLISDMGLGLSSEAATCSDMRKSNPGKGMTLCRCFGGRTAVCALVFTSRQ